MKISQSILFASATDGFRTVDNGKNHNSWSRNINIRRIKETFFDLTVILKLLVFILFETVFKMQLEKVTLNSSRVRNIFKHSVENQLRGISVVRYKFDCPT